MSEYVAPLEEMRFALNELADLPGVCALPAYAEVSADVADAVLAGAARFAHDVLSPLNASGDRHGARHADGGVTAPPGFALAYRQFREGGWNGISAPVRYGGQALPRVLALAVEEMWNGANLAFALAPMLTAGVAETLCRHGSAALRARYVPALVAGRWCGTMNLTEPQAGSDLSTVRTMATPDGDAWRLRGTKVFITWGEHDLAENIVHLVLARTPDAPEGVRGLSLFVVPKLIVGDAGKPGARNDIRCVSIERKLGLHASPTCVLEYGEREGALGFLVGEHHRGLEHMFTMMNYARIGVGLEGVAVAERAYQRALEYARVRVQGREAGRRSGERVAIVRHPDVRRMLFSMKTRISAMRALTYFAGAAYDRALHEPDPAARDASQRLTDLLTPVVKGWCTEQAVDIASLAIQVHGGTGYVEESGAPQQLRDARITTIYEGTTGIQALDLVGRKVAADGGRSALEFIARMRRDLAPMRQSRAADAIAPACEEAIALLERATHAVLGADASHAAAASVPYLDLFGTVAGGWMMARAAAIPAPQAQARAAAAAFYVAHVLPRCAPLAAQVECMDAGLGFDERWL
jgi:alkylation response protein AidB-like acyl-CoA dehydrogenase